MKIGHAVHAEPDAHIQIANAASLTENDVLVAISIQAWNCKSGSVNGIKKKAKIMWLASYLLHLDKYADIKLISAWPRTIFVIPLSRVIANFILLTCCSDPLSSQKSKKLTN